jgi:hypothetical protein
LGKRQFTIDTGYEKIPVEGHAHKNVAVKYLMRKRRSLLGTRDPQKIEKMYSTLPTSVSIIGKQLTHTYNVRWERVGSLEFQGSRFVFTLCEEEEKALNVSDAVHEATPRMI